MTKHEHISAEQAAGLVALPATDPERISVVALAEECEICSASITEGLEVLKLVDALPSPEPPSAEALARTSAAVLAELEKERATAPAAAPVRTDGLLVAAASILGWSAMIGFALWHHPDTLRWVVSASTMVVAAAGVVLAAAHGRTLILTSLLGSAALVAFAAGGGTLDPTLGIKCLATELAGATFPSVATLWLALRRDRRLREPLSLAGVASAGAVVGQAALLLTCPQHSVAHQLVFHIGGIALAVVAGFSVAKHPRLVAAFAGGDETDL